MGVQTIGGDHWETGRCVLLESRERDLPALASILAENLPALQSQGPGDWPEALASRMLRHENLPPGGDPSHEHTFLIADRSSNTTIGLLSIYGGYPSDTAFYIGSLFFRRDWQKRGLGREVVEDLERRAMENGYRKAYVAVGLKNWPALRFWVAMGFRCITRIAGCDEHSDTTYADIELTKTLKGKT